MLKINNVNRTAFYTILFLFIAVNSGLSQHPEVSKDRNILECMDIIGFDIYKYVQADIMLERTSKTVDIESDYYDIKIDWGEEIKLCQVAKYNNTDGTTLVVISAYYGDMQCSYHPFYFYEISKSDNRFILVEQDDILPVLDFSMFFLDRKPIQILEKYLPEIKKSYLDANATIEDVLNEVYDFHIMIPRKGEKIKVTLTVCDYIPRNEVSISNDDWNIIENSIGVLELVYDKHKKQFKMGANKK